MLCNGVAFGESPQSPPMRQFIFIQPNKYYDCLFERSSFEAIVSDLPFQNHPQTSKCLCKESSARFERRTTLMCTCLLPLFEETEIELNFSFFLLPIHRSVPATSLCYKVVVFLVLQRCNWYDAFGLLVNHQQISHCYIQCDNKINANVSGGSVLYAFYRTQRPKSFCMLVTISKTSNSLIPSQLTNTQFSWKKFRNRILRAQIQNTYKRYTF